MSRGRIDAPNVRTAAERLAQQGLLPIELTARASKVQSAGRTTIANLAIGLLVLADLLDAGLPVGRALAAIEAMTLPGWQARLPSIQESVREGKSLARAFEESGIAAPGEVIGILYAGERGAGLARAVRAAADICREAAETRHAIRSALAYPMLLGTAGTLSAGLLVAVVLPRFATILTDMGQSLPRSTSLLLASSSAFRAAALPGLMMLALLAAAWSMTIRRPGGRARWHALLLRLPLIGEIRLTTSTARFCSTLGAMLDAGVPVAASLPSAARASGDAALELRYFAAREHVLHGERVSRALVMCSAVTPMAARLIHAGEESGRLAALLGHAARLERERATRRVQALVRLIEPGLIIVFGGGIALIAASLLQALYSIRPGG